MVSADQRLANAVMWGSPSMAFLNTIALDYIGDEWARKVVAAVIVLRDEDRPVTLATVHELLLDAGIHDVSDAWKLVMGDVTANGGQVDEDAAAVYLEQARIEHVRRANRMTLVRAAHRLETAADPAVVMADLALEVAPT